MGFRIIDLFGHTYQQRQIFFLLCSLLVQSILIFTMRKDIINTIQFAVYLKVILIISFYVVIVNLLALYYFFGRQQKKEIGKVVEMFLSIQFPLLVLIANIVLYLRFRDKPEQDSKKKILITVQLMIVIMALVFY